MSILFADIQNFTPLTTTLSAQQLVETLNDLFGKFDDAAKASLDIGREVGRWVAKKGDGWLSRKMGG